MLVIIVQVLLLSQQPCLVFLFYIFLANYNNCVSFPLSALKYQNDTFTGDIINVCINCTFCCQQCATNYVLSSGLCATCQQKYGAPCVTCNPLVCLTCIDTYTVISVTCGLCTAKFSNCLKCTNTACT